MRVTDRKKKILLLLCSPLLAIVFYIAPVYAEDLPPPSAHPGNIKGFFEVDLSTQIATRTVVEETRPGLIAEGDAESTRILVRIAAKPLHPLELYLQAGMANLVIDDFDQYRGDYSFAYGGGVSLILYEYPGPKKFQIITRADTLHFISEDSAVLICPLSTCFSDSDLSIVKEKIQWREYTLEGIGLWRSQYWEPYLGVRFSLLDSTDKLNGPLQWKRSMSLEEDSNLGLVAGTNLYFDPRENFALNIEATLIDQLSLKIGLKVWY
ncbi:MAG: hypothetical protein HZC13_01565 [Nitrospirae bacterium]|nr:hypothetical protein [Nitrospirota bacterium]